MRAPWQFEVAAAADVLPTLRDEWQALLGRQTMAVPFQSPAWLAAYLQHGADDPAAVQLVTARQDGRLVAVLPLEIHQRRLGPLRVRQASLLHSPHMPLADITAAPDGAAMWPALRDWLLKGSGLRCVRLDLPGVSQDATLGAWLQAVPSDHRCVPTGEAARIDARIDYDSLIKGVSSKHRSNLSRSIKRAEAIGPLRFATFTGAELLTTGWPLLLEIEASGWKGRAGTAIGSDEGLQRFYREAIEGLDRVGQCRIGVLWFGDVPAAAGLFLTAGRVLYCHKLGYREEWANMSPGHLLTRQMLQEACADPSLDALSLVLHPAWCDVWRPELTPVAHHSLFAPTLLGRLAQRLAALRRPPAGAPAAAAAEAPTPD